MAGVGEFKIDMCKLVDRQERSGTKDGKAWSAVIFQVIFMGGDFEEFCPVDRLASSPFNGVKVGTMGTLHGELECRAVGDRKRLVPVVKAFHVAASVEGTNGRVMRAAPAVTAPGGFVMGWMIAAMVAVAAIVAIVPLARADDFLIKGTKTVMDGQVMGISQQAPGEYVGADAIGFVEFDILTSNVDDPSQGLVAGQWSLSVTDFAAGATVFEQSYTPVPMGKPILGGFTGDEGAIVPFGAVADYLVPFPVPEPASGLLGLGFGSTLAVRYRR